MSSASHLSLVYVKVPISAIENGSVIDPTTATVTMAFPVTGVDPVVGDWKTASWETDATRTPARHFARCLTGPTGTIALTAATYDVWTTIAGITPEAPVLKAGAPHIVT